MRRGGNPNGTGTTLRIQAPWAPRRGKVSPTGYFTYRVFEP